MTCPTALSRPTRLALGLAALAALAMAAPARAHVPYIEGRDYSRAHPFVMERLADSKAIYGWLASARDVDVVRIDVDAPATIAADLDVQVCPLLAEFRPSYAIVGPGLPPPPADTPLPVDLPPGYGAVVVPNYAPGVQRPTFYEPVGGHLYYDGIPTTVEATAPGAWAILVWDPYRMGGDYVLSTGYRERTTAEDLVLVATNTPVIRANGELHVPCPGN